MRWISVFCFICTFLCATLSISRADTVEGPLDTADHLFVSGKYFEASVAYEFVFYAQTDPDIRAKANLAKVQALKQLGEFDKAIGDLQRSFMLRTSADYLDQVYYELALCHYLAGDYTESAAWFVQLVFFYPQLRGCGQTGLLGALLNTQSGNYEEAILWMQKGMADSGMQKKEKLIALTAAYTEISTRKLRLPDKERARLYASILPGLGHMYAGEPLWGIANGLSQAAALTGFALLAMNGYYISGFVLGLGVFQMLYFGGIRQAGEFASNASMQKIADRNAALSMLLISFYNQTEGFQIPGNE